MKYAVVFAGILISLSAAGCMAGYHGYRGESERAERDSLQPPPMTVDDVIALAKDSVADDVIISQIRATDSYFQITTDEILRLKKEGVSAKVIDAMIKTSEEPKYVRRRSWYYPPYYYYPGYYWYPYPSYYWYPALRIGFSSYGGHYYGSHYGGYGTSHRSSGVRR